MECTLFEEVKNKERTDKEVCYTNTPYYSQNTVEDLIHCCIKKIVITDTYQML